MEPFSEPSPQPLVLLPLAGHLCLRLGPFEKVLHPPSELLFLPAGLEGIQTSAFYGWLLQLTTEDLSAQLMELSRQQIPRAFCRPWGSEGSCCDCWGCCSGVRR
jgi:hypothetical protein